MHNVFNLPKALVRTLYWLRRPAVLVVILASLGILITSLLPFGWGDPVLDAKLRHLESESYSLVFIGSSYTYRQISPRVFDLELKESLANRANDLATDAGTEPATGSLSASAVDSFTRSFNLAADGMHLPATGRLLEHLMNHRPQGLRTVVLELGRFLSTVDPDIDHTPEAQFWRTPAMTSSMIRFLWHRPDKGTGAKLFQTVRLTAVQGESSLGLGHGPRMIEHMLGPQAGAERALGPDQDGFYAVDRQALDLTGEPLKNPFLADPDRARKILDKSRDTATKLLSRPTATANPEGLKWIDRMMEQARAHDLELIFLVPPRLGRRYLHLRPLYDHIPADQLIHRLADPEHANELYRFDESADPGHFNALGAVRYSRLLAREVARLWTDSRPIDG